MEQLYNFCFVLKGKGKLKMFSLEYVFTYAVGNQISNWKYLLELIKGRSKVHQRNMSRKRGLNFDQRHFRETISQ